MYVYIHIYFYMYIPRIHLTSFLEAGWSNEVCCKPRMDHEFTSCWLNDNAMIAHNKTQTENQKNRRAMLGSSGRIVEAVIIQNDPSFTTMCKLIKLVTGCDTFSMLTPVRPYGNCYSIDMEALVGDPTNQEVDQEITLILNHYGFTEIYGENGELFKRLKDGKAKLTRQLVENEDYKRSQFTDALLRRLGFSGRDKHQATPALEAEQYIEGTWSHFEYKLLGGSW